MYRAHLAKYHMLAIQPACFCCADEEPACAHRFSSSAIYSEPSQAILGIHHDMHGLHYDADSSQPISQLRFCL